MRQLNKDRIKNTTHESYSGDDVDTTRVKCVRVLGNARLCYDTSTYVNDSKKNGGINLKKKKMVF